MLLVPTPLGPQLCDRVASLRGQLFMYLVVWGGGGGIFLVAIGCMMKWRKIVCTLNPYEQASARSAKVSEIWSMYGAWASPSTLRNGVVAGSASRAHTGGSWPLLRGFLQATSGMSIPLVIVGEDTRSPSSGGFYVTFHIFCII